MLSQVSASKICLSNVYFIFHLENSLTLLNSIASREFTIKNQSEVLSAACDGTQLLISLLDLQSNILVLDGVRKNILLLVHYLHSHLGSLCVVI